MRFKKKEPLQTQPRDAFPEYFYKPFGMGEAPLGFMLIFPALHTNDHAAQMDYIQTCYGDRKWN